MKSPDIVNKVFSKSFMGYDVREVDAFLDELIVELETLQRERAELTRTVEKLLLERRRAQLSPESAALPEPQLRLDGADTLRRGAKPRRIASVSIDSIAIDDGGGLTDETISEITEAVALEIETGAAAPRARAVGPEIRKVSQKTTAEPSAENSWKRNAEQP